MTNDDILKVARELHLLDNDEDLITFARRIAAMQRSETAEWLELNASVRNDAYLPSYVLKNCAAAIRGQSDD